MITTESITDKPIQDDRAMIESTIIITKKTKVAGIGAVKPGDEVTCKYRDAQVLVNGNKATWKPEAEAKPRVAETPKYAKLKVDELKELVEKRELTPDGTKKDELIAALEAADTAAEEED